MIKRKEILKTNRDFDEIKIGGQEKGNNFDSLKNSESSRSDLFEKHDPFVPTDFSIYSELLLLHFLPLCCICQSIHNASGDKAIFCKELIL